LCDEWSDFTGKYKSDEGDLVKILKSASDILKQISVYSWASFDFKKKCLEAYDLIFKSPIRDEL